MVKMFKRMNKLQIISVVGMLITLVLILLKVNNIINLFWIFIGLNIGGLSYFSNKWTNEGKTKYRKMDNSWNKNLTRKTSESVFFLLVLYVLIICSCYIAEIWIKSFTDNLYTILSIAIITIIINIISLYIVDKTAKEVKEFENNTK